VCSEKLVALLFVLGIGGMGVDDNPGHGIAGRVLNGKNRHPHLRSVLRMEGKEKLGAAGWGAVPQLSAAKPSRAWREILPGEHFRMS
jgi:hypothetical protein